MSTETISLADAKAHLSEITERAARGETLFITKHGKPVAQLVRPAAPRKPVSLPLLRALTDGMPEQVQSAGEFMREQRDNARY
ncbi:type II toxin-antitoxin system prevent-host-death family antitoxin [Haliea sp. E1-2-M8]|uniref:type II toxin-antitoxin system Phd/YefM family antitoxin n=1 Tax=Haliea sp. E1-2-M8 TaxID=3064706 RepID=UPI0027183C8B|nr:type II toxin-antitoxin system prevent-host-death family antitoxin [Haliea sp. E1-2-M8]MDO8862699.1 type II toxin-antitoxin system prevent-host-death family antitoxin [Haliea sp. E1-2-M8]